MGWEGCRCDGVVDESRAHRSMYVCMYDVCMRVNV